MKLLKILIAITPSVFLIYSNLLWAMNDSKDPIEFRLNSYIDNMIQTRDPKVRKALQLKAMKSHGKAISKEIVFAPDDPSKFFDAVSRYGWALVERYAQHHQKGGTLNELFGVTGNPLLLSAISNKKLANLFILLQYGADPNLANQQKNPPQTPLKAALNLPDMRLKAAMILHLLDHGAKFDEEDEAAIRQLIEPMRISFDLAIEKINTPAPLQAISDGQRRTFMCGSQSYMKLMIATKNAQERGMLQRLAMNHGRKKPHDDDIFAPEQISEFFKAIIFKGWSLVKQYAQHYQAHNMLSTIYSSKGETPLLTAVGRGRLSVVYTLLEQGANPNIAHRIFPKHTPIKLALQNLGNRWALKAVILLHLLDFGAHPDADDAEAIHQLLSSLRDGGGQFGGEKEAIDEPAEALEPTYTSPICQNVDIEQRKPQKRSQEEIYPIESEFCEPSEKMGELEAKRQKTDLKITCPKPNSQEFLSDTYDSSVHSPLTWTIPEPNWEYSKACSCMLQKYCICNMPHL